MKNSEAINTKKRPPSTGKNKVPDDHRPPDINTEDDDDWLSVDDLDYTRGFDGLTDAQRNGLRPHEFAVDYYLHRYTSPSLEPSYPPNVEELRKQPSRLEGPGFDYGFTPEFVDRCEAHEENRKWNLRHRIVDGKIHDTGWVNPDAKPQPAYINDDNRILACWLKVAMAYDGLADGYRNWTFDEAAEECGWTGKILAEAHQLAKDMGLLEREETMKKNNNGNGNDEDDDDDDDGINVGNSKGQKIGHKKDPLHIKIATMFILSMETDARLRRFADTEGNLHLWKYENGLWSWLPDRAVTKWLIPKLQQYLNYISHEKKSTIRVLNEAAQHVIRHELVCVDSEAQFDQHGKVPTTDGLIDPITHQIEPLKPEHFATWVLPKVKYDPDATCPYWIQMLNDALADKSKKDRNLDVQLIQDFMGMSLLDAKPKALQRGMILLGPGDSGKSSWQQVMAGMLAEKTKWITTPLSKLDGNHGTQAFIRRAPWVLGEAFTTSIWHLADTVKEILGGDNIEINPKNKDALSIKPNAPPIWATNFPPKFKEPTKAIVERIVVMELTQVFDKAKPIGVAVAAKKANPAWWPHDLVLNTERSGILNWMLIGAKRALERGHFVNTKAGEALLEGILDDSNVARAFIKDCGDFDPSAMISVPDFKAALMMWWEEHHGDDARPPNATMIGIHLKALADPRILQDKETFKDENGLRFYLGIKLNQAGLSHWETAWLDDRQSGRSTKSSARISSAPTSVTRVIKPEWLKLPEVETMQKAHRKHREKKAT